MDHQPGSILLSVSRKRFSVGNNSRANNWPAAKQAQKTTCVLASASPTLIAFNDWDQR
jgi:hypothetical protein